MTLLPCYSFKPSLKINCSIQIILVTPVLYGLIDFNAQAGMTLSIEYDNPNMINIQNVDIQFVQGQGPSLVVPSISYDIKGTITPVISSTLNAGIAGSLRIGPEIIVSVNGVPFTMNPVVRIDVGASIAVGGGHFKTHFEGGIGVDLGWGLDLKGALNPAQAAENACNYAFQEACAAIPGAQLAAAIAKKLKATPKDRLCNGEVRFILAWRLEDIIFLNLLDF